MAIWQYDFIAIPREEMVALYGGLPAAMKVEHFKSQNFWTTTQPRRDFEAQFSKWRPEIKSWHPDIRIWGSEESNRIDVSYEGERVNYVQFRIELRALSVHFIETIAAFARQNNCVLVSAHSLNIVEPIRKNILIHLCRSPGVNHVLDWLSGGTSTPSNNMDRPSVFLSHSSKDKSFVSRLATDLKSRGVPVWFDQWELRVGDSLTEKIEQGINQSGWLAVVLSKNSASSDWVQKELRAAQARELQDKNVFVLPIIIDDCEIPLFLLDKLYADFRTSYEHGLEALLKRVLEGADA
jgi:hypothetical protein